MNAHSLIGPVWGNETSTGDGGVAGVVEGADVVEGARSGADVGEPNPDVADVESAEPESDVAASDPDGEPTDAALGLSDDELSDVVLLHDAVTNPNTTTKRLAVRPRRSIAGGYTTTKPRAGPTTQSDDSARRLSPSVSPNVGASRAGELG